MVESAREYRLRSRRQGAESIALVRAAARQRSELVGICVWAQQLAAAGAVACAGRERDWYALWCVGAPSVDQLTYAPAACSGSALNDSAIPRETAAEEDFHSPRLEPMRMLSHRFLAYLLAACSLIGLTTQPIARAEAPRDSRVELIVGKSFAAHDTLATGHEAELDARNCLQGLVWEPNKFEVTLQVAEAHQGDVWVRFPSARPVGDATNDLAAMEWYQARDAAGSAIEAPAAVIVHESGSDMTVGRLIAKSLRSKGIHTFMLQLPYYGVRRDGERPQGELLIEALCQSIADARRARDAVAALPLVDTSRISLQGTSLGGFVVATTAGLDRGYHSVFILLAGGDLAGVLTHGKKDAQKVRQAMMAGGMGEGEFRQMLSRIEPLRLAHRIDANRTWLFSGSYDDVVPPHNSELLATTAHLPEGHHIKLLANHYSGIIFLPMISQQISQHMRE